MPMPAARPLQKRYYAGSCTLDVTLQLSVLSQWHSRPVVEQLAFKLWLQAVEQPGAEPLADTGQTPPTLIAEGDRTVLRLIARHLQQQTRATLAIAPLNVVTTREPRSAAQLPPNCLVQGSLSYLQLCDLTSVLSQYEQATCTLPVALNTATAQPAQNNLISFFSGRRHPLNRSLKVWASSAAVALFAVGITTTLWRTTRESTTSQTAFQKQAITPAESAPSASDSLPKLSAARPDPVPKSPPSDDTPLERADTDLSDAPDAPNAAQRPVSPPLGDDASVAPAIIAPIASAPPSSQVLERPQARLETHPPDAHPSETNSASAAPSSEGVPSTSVEPQLEAIANPEIAATSEIGQDALENELEDDALAMSEPADGPMPNRPYPTPGAVITQTGPASADVSADVSADASADVSEQYDASRNPPVANPRARNSRPSADSVELEPEAALAELSSQETDIIAQVQTYFQTKWRPDQRLAASPAYQLQLSRTGEVISVVSLNSIAQDYRDRLFPRDSSLSFSRDISNATEEVAPTAELMLLLTLTPAGEVQVSKR